VSLQACLVGFSGARITLHRSGGRMVVRKMAGTAAQNDRLDRQCDKQIRFHAQGVPTPRVLGWGTEQGRFFFDMEYIPAMSLAALIAGGHIAERARLRHFVAAWIAARSQQADGMISAAALEHKLESVLAAGAENPNLGHAARLLPGLAARLRRLAWPNLPATASHGDFTTENILSAPSRRLLLIDFDAPDLSSVWLDVAKLYQDLLGHWCLRHLAADPIGRRNAELALRQLRTDIDEVVAESRPGLLADLPALVCLHLLRALPYSAQPADSAFILERIETLLPLCRTRPACVPVVALQESG
jgi:aminoglycoside phosphotransferase (APT) family kinase protein